MAGDQEPSRAPTGRRWTVRVVRALLVGAVVAATGCSLIAELADQEFTVVATDGGPGHPMGPNDATSTDAASDATTSDQDAGPGPVAYAPPPCSPFDGGGWQLDCNFANGGFLILPNVQNGIEAPVASVNEDNPSQLLFAGVHPDERTSFVTVLTGDAINAKYGVVDVATTSAPVGVGAVPGMTAGAYAVMLSNAVPSDGGATGIDLTVVFGNDGGAFHKEVYPPDQHALSAVAVADFDAGSFTSLLLANRVVEGLSVQPAIVQVDLSPGSTDPPSFAYVDTHEGTVPLQNKATASSLGITGGFIATSPVGATLTGSLYQFDTNGIQTGVPIAKLKAPFLELTGGLATVADDNGDRGLIGFGATANGVAAEFFLPPSTVAKVVNASSTPQAAPDTIRLVQSVDRTTYYEVALSSANGTSSLTIARFLLDQESLLPQATGADGGLYTTQFATAMKLGSAIYYGGDICVSLMIGNIASVPNAAALLCFTTKDPMFGLLDGGDDAVDAAVDGN